MEGALAIKKVKLKSSYRVRTVKKSQPENLKDSRIVLSLIDIVQMMLISLMILLSMLNMELPFLNSIDIL